MYNILKNVQIIISLLKEYNIRHLVLSPGSRNVPFVHSVESDPFFKCYSIVDERGAGYFALGLAKELNEPVLISCTSSTASSNYLPAIRQAAIEGVQIIALTADRNPIFREQMENQMIQQPNMYKKYCKKAVDLPTVTDDMSFRYCERLVNEALLELNHHGKGPVQINFPAFYGFRDFPVAELPKCRKIERYEVSDTDEKWMKAVSKLKNYKKILLIYGESQGYSEHEKELLKRFFEKFNCAISVEHMSNINTKETLRTYPFTESASGEDLMDVMPELLITMQGNFTSSIKEKLRDRNTEFCHWRVSPKGDVVDTFNSLEAVFECTDEQFFEKILMLTGDGENDKEYYNTWKNKLDKIVFPDLGFTNFGTIKSLCEVIPAKSLLHLSILNSIRMTNFFDLQEGVQVYANVGAYGIDGSLSTFLGQAEKMKKLSFLIIGDLSFLYDASGIDIPCIGENVRIAIINNYGGGEFYNSYMGAGINNLSLHIAAGHRSEISSIINEDRFDYFAIHNQEELDDVLPVFVSDERKKPIIIEIFTNIEKDAKTLNHFYRINWRCKKSTMYKNKIRGALGRIKRIVKK